MFTFAPSTVIESAKVNQNFTDLSTGAADTTANSLTTFRSEGIFDFVASGLIWSGDAYASTLKGSMTSGVIVINGRRIVLGAVAAHTFTASKDTYIDVLDNADGTGTVVYTEATNNAASAALAANSVRIAIVVSGATNIAAAASVNQGQEDRVLPIASSIPYAVTDSIGNLICPRDPQRRVLGYRQITSDFTATTLTDITGLNLNFKIPTGRKAKVSGFIGNGTSSAINNGVQMALVDVTAGVTLASALNSTNASGDSASANPSRVYTPASTTINVKAQLTKGTNAATAHTNSTTTNPTYILVELD